MCMKNALDHLLDSIREFRRAKGWSIGRLARATGLSWSVLQHMDDASWSPSSETIRRLLTVMEESTSGVDEQEQPADAA